MKKLIILSFILLASIQINAQRKKNFIKGNGNVTEQTREVGSYDGIVVSGSFEVKLYAGNEGSIKVEAESNLLEYIETIVKDGKLHIGFKKGTIYRTSWGKGKAKIVSVPFKDINNIKLSGSGEIISKDIIKADHFEVALSGSGDIKLEVDAKVTGSGDIRIHCKDNLKARITGSGDIEYLGDPERQDTKVTGSGDITRG